MFIGLTLKKNFRSASGITNITSSQALNWKNNTRKMPMSRAHALACFYCSMGKSVVQIRFIKIVINLSLSVYNFEYFVRLSIFDV